MRIRAHTRALRHPWLRLQNAETAAFTSSLHCKLTYHVKCNHASHYLKNYPIVWGIPHFSSIE